MAIVHLHNVDLSQNELQNAVIQNLGTAPASPKEGQTYWNTTNKKWMIFNGTEWQEAASTDNLTANRALVSDGSGKVATADTTSTELGYVHGVTSNIQTQLDDLDDKIDSLDDDVVHLDGTEEITGKKTFSAGLTNEATVAQTDNSTNVATTAWVTTKVSTADATAVHKTGDETITGAKNFTGATVTVATQTAGDNSTKAASTAFVKKAIDDEDALIVHVAGAETVTGSKTFSAGLKSGETIAASSSDTTVPTTAWVKNAISDKIELTDLSIESGSTNYLTYDNATGAFGAKVDTNVTENSTNLITSGAVKSAIDAAVVGGVHYEGSWDITSATDYSGITLPVKKGYLYYVTGTGPKTIGGIEWNSGDYLLVDEDVASGTLVGKVSKIDNTESADIVRLNATQTLTNKTIDADNNTIQDLTTTNFKSGIIVTTVGTTGTDTALPTEKAVRTAITDATTSLPQKYTVTSPALTPTGGICTWTVTHGLADGDVIVKVKRVSDGIEVVPEITYTASTVVIKINSATSINAGTYKVVVIG